MKTPEEFRREAKYTQGQECSMCGLTDGIVFCYHDLQHGMDGVSLCAGCMADYIEQAHPTKNPSLLKHFRSLDARLRQEANK